MKKVFAIVMAALMVVSMFAGCKPAEPAGSAAGTLKIGMTGPLTGDAAEYGVAVEAGMKIAVAEINAAAEKNGGLKLELRAEDDQADGEKAVSAYKILKDWGMQVFIGTVTSGACNAVAPETVEDNMFLLTPSASALEVATAGKTTYQMCFTDPNQGASAAEVVKNKWADAKVGIIYDSSDDYSTGLYEGFIAKAKTLGVNVVCETSFTKDTKTDLATQVTQCKDKGATLMFLPIYYTEASQILSYAAKHNYEFTYIGCDGMDGILNVEGFDKSLAEGLALLTPFDANAADDATKNFVKAYKDMMGKEPNQFAADAYDCVNAVYKACVAAGIKGNESASDVCDAMIKQFNEMKFDGLTGKGMQWDEEGMISKAPAAVVITNGIYVPMT